MAELTMIFDMPNDCFNCDFNKNKYCSLKTFLNDETSNFVANYGRNGKRSPYCPLEREDAVQLSE